VLYSGYLWGRFAVYAPRCSPKQVSFIPQQAGMVGAMQYRRVFKMFPVRPQRGRGVIFTRPPKVQDSSFPMWATLRVLSIENETGERRVIRRKGCLGKLRAAG
jgi:hypothetical protein